MKIASSQKPVSKPATTGNVIILSGPSGAGKTTLIRRLLERMEGLAFSISHTTRQPREKEKNGIDYIFVDEQEFRRSLKSGDFIEWAEVHGQLYGTSQSIIDDKLNQNSDVLLEIDVQGSMQIKHIYPNAVSIMLIPPSWEALTERLRDRRTECEENYKIRLKRAKDELNFASKYDYVIVNDDLETAIQSVQTIILAKRLKKSPKPWEILENIRKAQTEQG